MKDRDRDAADDWMRDHMPSEDECSLEDNDERGCEQRYYFLRGRDSAMVVFRIRVKGGRVVSVKQEVFDGAIFPTACSTTSQPASGTGTASVSSP